MGRRAGDEIHKVSDLKGEDFEQRIKYYEEYQGIQTVAMIFRLLR